MNAFVFTGFLALGAGVLQLVDMAHLVFWRIRGQSVQERICYVFYTLLEVLISI